MGSDLRLRQLHLSRTANCFRMYAEPLKSELVTGFRCSDAESDRVVGETFLLFYERLEAGALIPCEPAWLYGTATRLVCRRRRLWRCLTRALSGLQSIASGFQFTPARGTKE